MVNRKPKVNMFKSLVGAFLLQLLATGLATGSSVSYVEGDPVPSSDRQKDAVDAQNLGLLQQQQRRSARGLDNGNLTVLPKDMHSLLVDLQQEVFFNYTGMLDPNLGEKWPGFKQLQSIPAEERYWLGVISTDTKLARLRPGLCKMPKERVVRSVKRSGLMGLVIVLNNATTNSFTVTVSNVARLTLRLQIITYNNGSTSSRIPEIMRYAESIQKVSVVRQRRFVDTVFDLFIIGVAMMSSFSVGCMTNIDFLKEMWMKPWPLVLPCTIQLFIMPLIALAVGKIFSLDPIKGLALLVTNCVPGGGLGNIFITVLALDPTLSICINFIGCILPLVTAPVWLLVYEPLFRTNYDDHRLIPIEQLMIWISASCASCIIGMIIHRLKLDVAIAILNWLVKPLLLFFSMLYITLGMYINMYIFELVESDEVVAAMIPPLISVLLSGTFLSVAMRLGAATDDDRKTAVIESPVMSCLLALATLKNVMEQPESDLAAPMPMWTLFITPGIHIGIKLVHKAKTTALSWCATQKAKQNDMTVASGLASVMKMSVLTDTAVIRQQNNDEDELEPVVV